jgi:replicative DNA helicase
MNAEVGLISKIIETGDFTIPTDMQISQRYFSGRNKKAFKFIQQHVLQYGNVPSKEVFESKMPNYQLGEAGEGLRYYCDEVRNKLKHNTIVDSIEEVSEAIENLESEEAYTIIKKLVLKIENEVILSDRVEVNKNTKSRLEDYHKRSKQGGMTGIPSGIDRLDYTLKGYNAGELIGILGYTGSGKTWMEIIQTVYMAKQGYKVLMFTTEMSTNMMIRRVDAVWCKLSYSRFRNGTLTPQELKRYEQYLEKIEGDTDSNLIVEQATGGISQIGAKIDQHQPDIVFIDGAYLLEDEETGDDDWRALVRIFRGLHRLALNKKLPIIASTQSKDRKISLETISFAKAISNDCDVIYAIEQDDEMKQDREIKVKFLKIREGEGAGNIVMNWDFSEMNYSTVYIEGGNGNPVQDNIKQEDDGEKVVQTGVQVLE